MESNALYHTTAATLASAPTSRNAAWLLALLAGMAILIVPNPWFVYVAVLMPVLLLASAYVHVRIHLDMGLLQRLALQQISDTDLQQALSHLGLRKTPPIYTTQQRCVACLALWYKSIVIDCVLSLFSIITLVIAV